MNSLKYIFYFLLGFIIYKIINYKVEGFSNNSFILLSRIIGLDDPNDPQSVRTQYIGCQNYECTNEIDTTDNYVDKKFNNDLNYLKCNNEEHYSVASLLGIRCKHDICCFNTNCSSNDVNSLQNSTCSEDTDLLSDNNCRNKNLCESDFQNYCCSLPVPQEVKDLFNSISGNTEYFRIVDFRNFIYSQLLGNTNNYYDNISEIEDENLDTELILNDESEISQNVFNWFDYNPDNTMEKSTLWNIIKGDDEKITSIEKKKIIRNLDRPVKDGKPETPLDYLFSTNHSLRNNVKINVYDFNNLL